MKTSSWSSFKPWYSLSTFAEIFAVGANGQRHFKGYEFFNSSSKQKNQLREQLLIQFDIFKNSYRFFIHDYEEYNFPEDLDKKTIIATLNFWKSFVKYLWFHYKFIKWSEI